MVMLAKIMPLTITLWWNGKDDNGDLVLMHTASKGKLQNIRILLHAGVDDAGV